MQLFSDILRSGPQQAHDTGALQGSFTKLGRPTSYLIYGANYVAFAPIK